MIKTCTYCGRTGHSAHECPNRTDFPLRLRDLWWTTVLVTILAVVARLGLGFGHA